MKLTKEQVEKMLPGQTLTAICNDAAELASTYEVAKRTRRQSGISAEDMPISCSYKTLTVTIRMVEKGGRQ